MQTSTPYLHNRARTTGGQAFLRYRLGYWIGLILLLLFSVVVLAPFAWVVATSLRTPAESFSVPPQWIPIHPDFSNYQQVFERIPFWKQIFNSFVVIRLLTMSKCLNEC